MADKVQSAIEFLSDPSTLNSSLESKVQFLESKGLSSTEINQALGAANSNRRMQYTQPQRYELQRDWRDYFIMAVVSGGLAYGIGSLAKRYLWPHLQPPTSTQYEADLQALNDKYDEAEGMLKELREDTTAIKDSLAGQQDKVNETVVEIERAVDGIKSSEKRTRDEMDGIIREISDIKAQIPKLVETQQQAQASTLNELQSELKSLKSLLLSRQNGGTTSPSSSIQIGKPQIPAWQLATANGSGSGSATSPSNSHTSLLTNKNDGFGIVWIAATLSAKSNLTSLKRLTKKDILNFSVPDFCQTLQNPPEPLALRLSSNLLFGVVRIYDRRLMFFEHDVQQVHNDLLRAITNMQSAPSDKRINLSDDRARIDQITLERHLLHEPDNIRNVDLQLEMTGIDIDDGFGHLNQDSHIASLSAFDSQTTGVGRADQSHDAPLFEPIGPLDWSLSSHAGPGADLPADIAQSASQQFLQERPPSRQLAAGLDEWGMPLEDVRGDFFDDVVQDERQEGLGDNFFNFDIPLENATAQAIEERRKSRDSNAAVPSSSPLSSLPQLPRPVKRRRLAVDARLDLFDDELRGSRENYVSNMERGNVVADHRNRIHEEEALARTMVTNLPYQISRNEMLGAIFPNLKTITIRREAIVRAADAEPMLEEAAPIFGAEGAGSAGMGSSDRGGAYGFDMPMDDLELLPMDGGGNIEYGRAVTGSPRGTLPWERADFGMGAGRPSTASPSAASLHKSTSTADGRRFSLDPLGSAQKRKSSARSPITGSITGGDISLGLDNEALAGLDEALIPEADLDNQTNKFLSFAKGLYDSNGGTGPVVREGVPSLVMNDICPATLTARFVAVNAFHNILVLADKSMIKVHGTQDPKEWSISLS